MEVIVEMNPVFKRIWEEWLVMDKRLSEMTEEERIRNCEEYQWIYPKSKKLIDLEVLYSSIHKERNRNEFCRWFLVVCGCLLSRIHLGENSYWWYQTRYMKLFKRDSCYSDVFPQRILLVLGMLGYITGLKEGYSFHREKKRNHGYLYTINIDKLTDWGEDNVDKDNFSVSCKNIPEWEMSHTYKRTFYEKGEDADRISWTIHPDWLSERQRDSISSVEVSKDGMVESSKWLFSYDEYKSLHTLSEDEQENLLSDWISYQKLRNLSCGIVEGCLDDSKKSEGKGYAGRFYSIMTNMRSEHRHKYLRLDGELVSEVDISSAQPSFLGVKILQETGVKTEWLKQSLTGNFYEWIKEKTNTQEDRKTIKKWMMQYLYSCYQPKAKKDYIEPHHPTYENKKTNDPFLCFQQRLNTFLKSNEPLIYKKIEFYKRHPEYREDKPLYKKYLDEETGKMKRTKTGEGKWCSLLSYELVKMEVEYIKNCIHALPMDLKFWTIHDCICVKESKSQEVKSIMEKVSREMYGLTLNLKRENISENQP